MQQMNSSTTSIVVKKPARKFTAFAKIAAAANSARKHRPLPARAAKYAALMAEPDELYPERILYPRSTRTLVKTPVLGGTPINEETCMELRMVVFGSSASPPKVEWARTGLTLRPPNQSLSFGLRSPRNSTRGLITTVQAIMLKHFLFKANNQDKMTSETLLKPNYDQQMEVLACAIAEIIWRCAGGFATQSASSVNLNTVSNISIPKAIVTLPQETPYLQHSVQYFQDGLTETLHLFEFTSLEDLEIFIKRYLYLFQDEGSPGAKLLLYSAVLSRGFSKIRSDLEDSKGSLLSGSPEEGPLSLVLLALTGRASPHLHNGVVHVGDENTYAVPQWGVLVRSEIGFLIHEGDGQLNRQPGSRLKTPSLPIWVTLCLGHHGVIFNTNRELLRNYHAERRFDVQYYTCGGSHATLTIDTKARENASGLEGREAKESLDMAATPLEKLIHSKWQDAEVQWNGTPML